MTGTKIVIIVLVLVVVLFVVLLVWGGRDSNQSSDTSTHPAFMDGLNQMLGSRAPKVDAAHLRPPLTVFDLQQKASYTIEVLPDGDHTLRSAKMRVQPPNACAHVLFRPSSDTPEQLNHEQDSNNPKVTNRNEFSLTVAKGGGTLIISRQSPLSAAPCTVVLQ